MSDQMVKAPPNYVWCACGGIKRKHAKQCNLCWREEQRAARTCECGNLRSYRAKQCEQCRRDKQEANRKQPFPGAAHGTESGYYRHLRGRQGEPPTPACQRCLDAHAAATRARTGAQPRQYKSTNQDAIVWRPRRGVLVAFPVERTNERSIPCQHPSRTA